MNRRDMIRLTALEIARARGWRDMRMCVNEARDQINRVWALTEGDAVGEITPLGREIHEATAPKRRGRPRRTDKFTQPS